MKTYAPSSTKRFAVAKPIPVVPPVTTATFPCNLPIIVSPFADESHRRSSYGPDGRPLSAAFEMSNLAPSPRRAFGRVGPLCLVPSDIHGLGACFLIQAAIAAAASP